jgi:hypothetical protein
LAQKFFSDALEGSCNTVAPMNEPVSNLAAPYENMPDRHARHTRSALLAAAADFDVRDEVEFKKIVPPDAKLEKLATD